MGTGCCPYFLPVLWDAMFVHSSPVDGGQLGRSDADGELSTIEVGLSPGFVDGEVAVAVPFVLCPEERAGVGVDRLRHGWGQSRGHPAAGGETAWPGR